MSTRLPYDGRIAAHYVSVAEWDDTRRTGRYSRPVGAARLPELRALLVREGTPVALLRPRLLEIYVLVDGLRSNSGAPLVDALWRSYSMTDAQHNRLVGRMEGLTKAPGLPREMPSYLMETAPAFKHTLQGVCTATKEDCGRMPDNFVVSCTLSDLPYRYPKGLNRKAPIYVLRFADYHAALASARRVAEGKNKPFKDPHFTAYLLRPQTEKRVYDQVSILAQEVLDPQLLPWSQDADWLVEADTEPSRWTPYVLESVSAAAYGGPRQLSSLAITGEFRALQAQLAHADRTPALERKAKKKKRAGDATEEKVFGEQAAERHTFFRDPLVQRPVTPYFGGAPEAGTTHVATLFKRAEQAATAKRKREEEAAEAAKRPKLEKGQRAMDFYYTKL